jgi:nucleoside-diphosphate-sugar epimerase
VRIVGRGLIAQSLAAGSGARVNAVAFASGVADSSCRDAGAFERECHLLASTIDDARSSGETLVYFSGGGALYGTWDLAARETGPAEPRTPYGRHQLECEALITAAGIPYLIVRLPNVVGSRANPTQLVPNLVRQVLGGRVTVQAKAARDLIDARDMAQLTHELLRRGSGRDLVNLATGHAVPVVEIVAGITAILGAQPAIDLVEAGMRQRFDTSNLQRIIGRDPFPDPTYYRGVLRRHVPGLAEELKHAGA